MLLDRVLNDIETVGDRITAVQDHSANRGDSSLNC